MSSSLLCGIDTSHSVWRTLLLLQIRHRPVGVHVNCIETKKKNLFLDFLSLTFLHSPPPRWWGRGWSSLSSNFWCNLKSPSDFPLEIIMWAFFFRIMFAYLDVSDPGDLRILRRVCWCWRVTSPGRASAAGTLGRETCQSWCPPPRTSWCL